MSAKTLNYILLLIICSLVIILVKTNHENQSPSTKGNTINRSDSFLINFDLKDYEHLKTMVTRFKEGKGDNLMIIQATLEGVPSIHDVMSNGREIRWTVDNSRDPYSSDKGKTEYICRAIDIKETNDHYNFELSKCNNYEEKEKLRLVSFLKERL
ncbi:DUF4362 domain-containing protein [Paenibacillus psychroresistens]|uniref:DUF4362 domain-containing protein n=1 Tax=Paenibacillus psychroresistens TaxID=1778678 RepID=A0A6B8RVS5_9BACL|nr:DUF4362 domain-containing protein [Paenibacillus psychroresistens]QGQ99543.1 DUF4362 domain-containing protein [Paenibacillus psychroresistens]